MVSNCLRPTRHRAQLSNRTEHSQLAPLMQKKDGLDRVAAIAQRLRSNADNQGYGDLSIKKTIEALAAGGPTQ